MRNPLRVLVPAGGVALLALLPVPAAAQTDGYVMHCFSARAEGMGCVTRGREGVPSNLFKDPAGIIAFQKPALEVNVGALIPKITFQNQANASGADGAVHGYPLASVAYVGPRFLPTVAWAVGVDPIGGMGSDFKLNNPVLGPNQNYESFFAGIKAGPVLAWEVAPGLSVGASASLLYSQIRYFRMPLSMPPSAAKGMAGLVQMDPAHYPALFSGFTEMTAYGDTKGFAGTGAGADLGISWKPSPKLRVSASWSPKSTMKLNGGTATVDFTTQFGQLFGMLVQERMTNHGQTQAQAQATLAQMFGQAGIDLTKGVVGTYDAKTQMAVPQTWGVGASYHPAAGWTLALETGWMGWKAAQDTMPFTLSGGDNTNLNILMNGSPTANSFSFPMQMKWQDTWILKGGVERDFGTYALRAGYVWNQNPIPDNTVFIAFPAIAEQSVMVGATVHLAGLPLDLKAGHAFKKEVTGATPSLVGSEYRNSVTDLSGWAITIGTVINFKYYPAPGWLRPPGR